MWFELFGADMLDPILLTRIAATSLVPRKYFHTVDFGSGMEEHLQLSVSNQINVMQVFNILQIVFLPDFPSFCRNRYNRSPLELFVLNQR